MNNPESKEEQVISFLNKNKIPFEKFSHKPVFTVAESSKIDRDIPGAHMKSLFLRSSKERFFLCCIPAQSRLNLRTLKEILNTSNLEFASPEELLQELNLTPGSVSIFGLLNSKNTLLILDSSIENFNQLGFHPNVNTSTYVFTLDNLKLISKMLCPDYILADISTK